MFLGFFGCFQKIFLSVEYHPSTFVHLPSLNAQYSAELGEFLIASYFFTFVLQVLSLSSAQTCTKPSLCLMPTSASVTLLSTTSTATRRSCLKLYCWLDSIPTSFRYRATTEPVKIRLLCRPFPAVLHPMLMS